MNTFILRQFYRLIGMNPAKMEMVQYWKDKESVQAKITKSKDGSLVMYMEGEKYPFPTYPRGHLLFGPMSKLKHEIKNQIFNDSWWALERGESKESVIKNIKEKLFNEIEQIAELSKYDMLPPETMCPSVREIHRAWTQIAPKRTYPLRDYLTFILQEDDAYRFRCQDMAQYFNPNAWWKKVFRFITRKSYLEGIKWDFEVALTFVEHCEVVGDMKERIRLLRRILMLCLEDKSIGNLFEKFCREVDWRKLYLAKADKFHFRGKYYKTDYRLFEY